MDKQGQVKSRYAAIAVVSKDLKRDTTRHALAFAFGLSKQPEMISHFAWTGKMRVAWIDREKDCYGCKTGMASSKSTAQTRCR